MKEKKKFKILKEEYFDDYGTINGTVFLIQEKKSFLGISYWKYITRTERGWGDSYKVPITFGTKKGAEEFIANILCPNKPRDKHVKAEITEINCTQS
jgi:hypothetical protein